MREDVHSPIFYGQENNGLTWALAMMNMFLHNIQQPRLEWGDTLKSPTLLESDHEPSGFALMRYNVVVANPPFSLDKWGAENGAHNRYQRFWRGVPPRVRAIMPSSATWFLEALGL